MQNHLRRPDDLESDLAEFMATHELEIAKRYNALLPQINAANGRGINSIHNKQFGSKGFYFGASVQRLYLINNGQPAEIPASAEQASNDTKEEVAPISTDTHHAALHTAKPLEADKNDDDDNDSSEFIARHAS